MKTPIDESARLDPVLDVAPGDGIEDGEPRREISPSRVAGLLLVLALLVGAGAYALTRPPSTTAAAAAAATSPTWFAPYVDTTLTPVAQFQDPQANPSRQVALGFVVADPKQRCTPSWGGAYGLDPAASALGLDRRIAQLRSQGGNVLASFGGAANSELAVSCTNVASLTAAYAAVVSRYDLSTVDFDVEGTALADTAANQRRAAAIAAVQRSAKAKGAPLAVWLTLPVSTTGLQADAIDAVSTTLAAGVDLAGVNVMAMNYGEADDASMSSAVTSSLEATHTQLARVYGRFDLPNGSAAVWNRMGATVMIGQNDTDGEVFTTADATQLTTDAQSWRLGRLSMWSLNRDHQCGGTYAIVGVHSNTCSGTQQTDQQFAGIFGALAGSIGTTAGSAAAPSVGPSAAGTGKVVADDPATSPYPLWQPNRPYETGYKVVREGDVYQAKWFNRGQDPAAQTADAYQTPWQIVGPVLPGEHPAPIKRPRAGTYPTWSPNATYPAGERVLYDGLPYEAKWYNTATSPGAQDADPTASPWKPLFTVPGEPMA